MAEGPQAGPAQPPAGKDSRKGKPADSAGFGAGQRLPEAHRPLPASLDAEMGVLSSILLSPKDTLTTAIEKGVDEQHFHHPSHGTIYAVLEDLWKKNSPIDLITVTQSLADRNLLDQVGGPATLAHLQTFLPTAANADYYIDIMREKHLLRRMIMVCTSSAARCYEEQGDVKTLIDDVEKQIFTVGEERVRGELPDMKDHVNAALDSIEKLYKNKGEVTGVPTGYKVLDTMTSGMHPSEMIVIAARPSMGKTALAMNIAEHVAVDKNIPVAVFSLEMSAQQLVQRLLCSRARVNLQNLRNGIMPKGAQQSLIQASAAYGQCKMYIDDTAGLSILELRAKSRRLMDKHKLGLIVIDYLQLLKSPSKRGQENRQIEIAEISGGIKALAKELGIPIIVLAQLNRKSEDRGDGKPRISDLRESGSIEQDADLVGLLYRSAYYAKDEEDRNEKGGESELIIAKQRNGPTGEVPLTFLSEFTRFESRDVSHGDGH
ncbi:MAG: replicative DNA helicase [Chthoniobacterales bacterium]|jgi:replicative DNA helicase